MDSNTPHYADWDYCAKKGGCAFELEVPWGTPIFSHLRAKHEKKLAKCGEGE